MGFSIANAGAATEGMLQVKDRYDQYRRNAIVDEGLASNVRQQQEREAFERMARQNIQGMQWNPGQLPQGQVQSQPQVGAPAPGPEQQVSARNENYGNEGRSKPPVVTGELEKLQAERAQYEQLLKGVRSNRAAIDASRAPRPSGPTVDDGYGGVYTPETGRRVLMTPQESQQYRDLQGQEAGYKQGIAQYDELIAEQAKKQHKQTMAESPSSPGNDKIKAFVTQYGPAAEKVGAQIGVDPKILLAQWGHETGWGKSVIPGTNNLGNIKGKGPSAKDNMTGSVDTYRQYGSPDEFGADYASLIQRKYGGAVGAGSDVGKFTQGLSGYAEDPQYAAKIANSYRMVGGVLGTAAPQQQTAAAPQQAPQQQNLSGQATMVSGPNYDLFEQQLKQKFDFLNMALRNTFGSQERLVIQQQLMALQQQAQELPIKRLADSAQFNPQAMQQLVSLFAGRVGQQLGVLQDGKGNVQLVGANGQPIPGQWGQVMPAYTLAATIGDKLTPSYAAARAAKTAAYDEAQAKSSGESEGKRLLELQKLQMQGHNMIGAQMMHGEMDIQKMLLEQGMSANEIKQASYSPAGDGIVVRTPRGVFEYKPGGVDPKTKVKTEPTLTPVMVTGGVGGAFQGAYPRG